MFKLETIGDAWVGVCNLTKTQLDHAARIARFSIDAVHAAQRTAIHPGKPEMAAYVTSFLFTTQSLFTAAHHPYLLPHTILIRTLRFRVQG